MSSDTSGDNAVTVQTAVPRAIAAVSARLHGSRVSASFTTYLNQVYAAARDGLVKLDGQNIFVYRNVAGSNDEVDVDFGVGVTSPFADAGQVRYTTVPTGTVATLTHWGNYAGLRGTHHAIINWCRENNRELAGPRWEVYGHWDNNPANVRTDVYYLLRPQT